jgi:hypothetical protein
MRQIISFLFIIFVVAPTLCEGILEEISPQDANETKMVLPLNGYTNDSIASNAAILKKLSISSAQSQAETVFVIGESAIARTKKNLANLSNGQEIDDDGKLTKLYSEMGSAFSTTNIPIKLLKYDSKIPQLPGYLFPGLANDSNEPRPYYFEPVPPSSPVSDIASGNKETRGGVTVIWNP